MSFQVRFVDYLKRNVPEKTVLAEELAEILNVSKDSAYRRLRNTTPLSIDEAMIICERFNLNLSYFFSSKYQIVPFSFNKLLSGDGGLIKYLLGMKQVIEDGIAVKAKAIFAAEDIPVFHHFEYPKLAGFKLFYWQKAVMNEPFLVGQRYRMDLVHPDVLNASLELAKAYNEIDSVEIWTEESINATLSQILYFVDSGQFEDVDYALAVLNEMELMIENLQKKAERSSKTLDDNKNFVLYNSEVRIGNNCILIEKPDGREVYISHNTFNSIRTESREFCDETALWMENLIRKSTSINDVSEKHRFQFFNVQFKKIAQTRDKIKTTS